MKLNAEMVVNSVNVASRGVEQSELYNQIANAGTDTMWTALLLLARGSRTRCFSGDISLDFEPPKEKWREIEFRTGYISECNWL